MRRGTSVCPKATAPKLQVREYMSTEFRAPVSTETHGRKRFSVETHRKFPLFLQKSPEASGEFPGRCGPKGIRYSSSSPAKAVDKAVAEARAAKA